MSFRDILGSGQNFVRPQPFPPRGLQVCRCRSRKQFLLQNDFGFKDLLRKKREAATYYASFTSLLLGAFETAHLRFSKSPFQYDQRCSVREECFWWKDTSARLRFKNCMLQLEKMYLSVEKLLNVFFMAAYL